MLTRLGSILGVALVSVAIAACGGGGAPPSAATGSTPIGAAPGTESATPQGSAAVIASPGTGSGTAVDACVLLTDDDVSAVTGYAVNRHEAGTVLGVYPNGCQWFFSASTSLGVQSLVLGVLSPGGKALYDTSFGPFAEEFGYDRVDGLGDAALRQAPGALMTLQGDTLVDVLWISGATGDAAGLDEVARELVERALARAPG